MGSATSCAAQRAMTRHEVGLLPRPADRLEHGDPGAGVGGGGLTFYFAVRGWMRHSIDQELAQRVHVRQDWNRLLDRKHAEDKPPPRRGRAAVDRRNLGPAA